MVGPFRPDVNVLFYAPWNGSLGSRHMRENADEEDTFVYIHVLERHGGAALITAFGCWIVHHPGTSPEYIARLPVSLKKIPA